MANNDLVAYCLPDFSKCSGAEVVPAFKQTFDFLLKDLWDFVSGGGGVWGRGVLGQGGESALSGGR